MTSMTRRCFLRGAVATPALIAGTRAARAEDDRLFSAWEGGEIGNALFPLALSPREGLRNTRLTHSSGLVLADGANFQLEINPGDLVELEKNAALDVGLKTLGLDFEVIGADGKAGQIVEAFRIRLSRPRRATQRVRGSDVCPGDSGSRGVGDLPGDARRNFLSVEPPRGDKKRGGEKCEQRQALRDLAPQRGVVLH